MSINVRRRSIPDWIRMSVPGGESYAAVVSVMKNTGLHTVCMEARCPNIGECFNARHAAFLVLGDRCTRNCKYCAVTQGLPPLQPDPSEPDEIAGVISTLGLDYAVVTSVTRDDLPDGGASHFAAIVSAVRLASPDCFLELLIPDFLHAGTDALDTVIDSVPDRINHNIEVVSSLFRELRPLGDYHHSLGIIRRVADSGVPAKSGLMIGFGETDDDIRATLDDLIAAGCSTVTVGQYLRSRKDGFPVKKYYHPDEFETLREYAVSLGFTEVRCSPLSRSSYRKG